MKRLFVMAERSRTMSTPSRDEELTQLPSGKWFDKLKAAFEWADSSNLLGDMFGWQANVYLLTAKKWIKITKVTEQMIYENELYEALEGLRASYYEPSAEVKSALNKVYGDAIMDKIQVAVYEYKDSVPLNEDEINSASAALQRRKEQHGNPEQE